MLENISVKKRLRNNIRVIVVDDDPDMVDITTEYLEHADIKVVGTGFDGKDAVTLYSNLHPDLVILDMRMPNYDGRYAIKNIIQQDPHTKIIVITDYADDYDYKENGIERILRKPFDISELVKAIDLAME